MKTTTLSFLSLALFSSALWLSLNSSLTDMTRNDCNAGVQRACQALAK